MVIHTWHTCGGRMPEEVDVDGIHDASMDGMVVFIGKARRQPDGHYVRLANVNGSLCRVEVSIWPGNSICMDIRTNRRLT